MTDQPPKVPVLLGAKAMTMTAVGSSAAGDQAGNAMANIITWLISLACKCDPPAAVLGGIHTLCVMGVVGGACYAHYKFATKSQP